MRLGANLVLLAIVLLLAVVPLAMSMGVFQVSLFTPTTLAVMNLLGWLVALMFLLARIDFRRKINRLARSIGIETRFKSFELVMSNLITEVSRKNDAFALNLLEKRIISKKELSRTLEHIVALAFKLLRADSAELALFDKESGMYHSSFVMGKPFRSSAQAMLSNAVEGEKEEISPDVLVQPVTFAGSILGTLRVALKKGTLPSGGDREIMRLMAVQGGLAIINSQYMEELLQMKRSSEESLKVKTGFLANLSHEIRGPLGIMLNAVELVLDGLCGDVSKDQAETLQMVRSNGEHLLELINDVLDYAKVESGRVAPQKVDVVVDELLKDIVGVVRSQAEAKSHKLTFKSNTDLLAISCDRRHIRQMLINMLTNSIKYTPDGGQIELWAERVPVNKIRISVRDNGIGIDESSRHKVFSAFERIENSYTINQVGTGLGMPLTRRLAEVNGALIDFRSAPNKGSHFWLVFPAVEYDSSIRLDEKQAASEAQGRGETILLVEKDQGERKMIARYLDHIGFQVVATASTLEAIEAIRSRKVDLVMIDNNAADNPKDELLAGIRQNSKEKTLPVLLISSRGFAFDIEKYLKSGIDRCLIKPIELKQLGVICRELIDRTYTGSIVDRSDLEPGREGAKKGDKDANPTKTRVMELDDVLH